MKSNHDDFIMLYNTARNINIMELNRVRDLASVFEGGVECIENFIRASLRFQELCHALKQYKEDEFIKQLSKADSNKFVESLKSAVVTKEGITYL